LKDCSIQKGESDDLEDLLAQIPYLNIYWYIPSDEQKTYDESKLVVASLRYDIDDTDPAYVVTGYDFQGNIYKIYGNEDPDFEVLVLGVNERVEHLKYYTSTSYQSLTKGMGDGTTLATLGIYLNKDLEGWGQSGADVCTFYLFAPKDPYTGDPTNITCLRYVEYPDNSFKEKTAYYAGSSNIRASLFAWDPSALGQNLYVYFYDDDWGTSSSAKVITVTISRDGKTITKNISCTKEYLGSPWSYSPEDDELFKFYMNYQDAKPTKYYPGNGWLIIGQY